MKSLCFKEYTLLHPEKGHLNFFWEVVDAFLSTKYSINLECYIKKITFLNEKYIF